MTTFEQARDIVRDARVSAYPPGDFYVAEYGWENDQDFHVIAGNYADVHDVGDPDAVTMDSPVCLVSKRSGRLRLLYGLERFDYPLGEMTPIGDVPDES